jgi:peptidoglycan-N-acetylglucosamine deacetylase
VAYERIPSESCAERMRPAAKAAGLTSAVGLGALLIHAGPALAGVSPFGVRGTPRLVGVGRRGHVALTFDDGPDPVSTPEILDVLDELGWHATFFMLGDMVRRAPVVARAVAAAGHEVAVHGDVHRNMLRRTPRAAADDVARAYDTIAIATDAEPRWFRPPFGISSSASLWAARRRGMRTVLWTTWGRDWRREATPESVVAEVTRRYLDGGTVLLHDSDCESYPGSWKSTLGALPRLAEELAARGLVVGPVGDHEIESAKAFTYPR